MPDETIGKVRDMATLRILFSGQNFAGDGKIDVFLDGKQIGGGSAIKGIDILVKAALGRHTLSISLLGGFRTKMYSIQLGSMINYEAHIKYSRMWGNFTDSLDLRPIPDLSSQKESQPASVRQPVAQTVPFKKNKLSTNKKVILIVTIIFVPIVLLLIMAWFGSTEFVQWDNAQSENSIQAYQRYLEMHPQGSHASEARSSLATLTDADNKLREVCSGRGSQEAAIFTASGLFHPITVYRLEDGHLLNIDGTIPREWRPLSVKDCELVACVEEQKKVIVQTCRYTGEFKSTRYQFQTRVVLRAAITGKVVAENLFTGSEPPQCPVSITKGSPFNIRTREGTEVKFRDIKGWLKGHVNPMEER